jgi:TatA/E family protein of Tat protein translocase
MGIENPVHLIFIAAVALIVLGPKRLPELAKALGHGIREFREAMSHDGPAPSQPPLTERPPALVAEPPLAHEAPPPEHQTAAEGPWPVDPAQTIRSDDAPDRRPL